MAISLRRLALALCLTALPLAAGARPDSVHAGDPTAALAGRYLTTLVAAELPATLPEEARAFLSGVWELELQATGRFTVRRDGVPTVEGSWTATAAELVLSDDAGEGACLEPGEETGRYRWSRGGEELRLSAVADACDGRRLVLTLRPFLRLP